MGHRSLSAGRGRSFPWRMRDDGEEAPASPGRNRQGHGCLSEDKYEFKAPAGWKLLREVSGGDFEFGFLKFEKGTSPVRPPLFMIPSLLAALRTLDARAKQYCTRFLWNSGILAEVKKQDHVQLWGHEAILMQLEGENPEQG